MSGSNRAGPAEKPKLGAPLPPRGLPSEPMIETPSSPIPPDATSTPEVWRTVFSRPAGNGGTCASSVSITSREVTTASVPLFDSVKIWSNERSIVSVRM